MTFTNQEEHTIQQRVTGAVGDELFEVALVAEEQNSIADSELRWVEYDRISDLPERPLDGWERLVVFTDRFVYRWKERDFHRIRERTPRHPDTVLDE